MRQAIFEYLEMINLGSEQLIFPILADLYSWGKYVIQKLRKPGMYEVLDYASILEISDIDGKSGRVSKIEKVRFLQDNVIAIQDQLWGFNRNIVEYKCSPGEPVDFYQSGYKTFVVISLREVKLKDDEDLIHFEWDLTGNPIGDSGVWQIYIDKYTHKLDQKIIFPQSRPPSRVLVSEVNSKRSYELNQTALTRLPDKRWQISWIKKAPRLYETYVLKWEW